MTKPQKIRAIRGFIQELRETKCSKHWYGFKNTCKDCKKELKNRENKHKNCLHSFVIYPCETKGKKQKGENCIERNCTEPQSDRGGGLCDYHDNIL